jgi:hypothetical protein
MTHNDMKMGLGRMVVSRANGARSDTKVASTGPGRPIYFLNRLRMASTLMALWNRWCLAERDHHIVRSHLACGTRSHSAKAKTMPKAAPNRSHPGRFASRDITAVSEANAQSAMTA